jgi:hypothetical protein
VLGRRAPHLPLPRRDARARRRAARPSGALRLPLSAAAHESPRSRSCSGCSAGSACPRRPATSGCRPAARRGDPPGARGAARALHGALPARPRDPGRGGAHPPCLLGLLARCPPPREPAHRRLLELARGAGRTARWRSRRSCCAARRRCARCGSSRRGLQARRPRSSASRRTPPRSSPRWRTPPG